MAYAHAAPNDGSALRDHGPSHLGPNAMGALTAGLCLYAFTRPSPGAHTDVTRQGHTPSAMRKRTTQMRVRLLKSYFDGGGLDELTEALRSKAPPRRREPAPPSRPQSDQRPGTTAARSC